MKQSLIQKPRGHKEGRASFPTQIPYKSFKNPSLKSHLTGGREEDREREEERAPGCLCPSVERQPENREREGGALAFLSCRGSATHSQFASLSCLPSLPLKTTIPLSAEIKLKALIGAKPERYIEDHPTSTTTCCSLLRPDAIPLMSLRVLLESSLGQFWKNCRNRVRGAVLEDPPNLPVRCFRHTRQAQCRHVSDLPPEPSPTWPTSTHPSRWFFLSYQQTPRCPALAPGVDRNAAQQWPKHLGRPSPPHGRPVGPPTPLQGLPPPHGRRAPCHRNAAAWSICTRLALVQTISLPPRHPCTYTPQTKNLRNLQRVATKHS